MWKKKLTCGTRAFAAKEDPNKTICNLSNLVQFHLSSLAFSFKSFISLCVCVCVGLVQIVCDDGDCELYRRSMIEMCLTEIGFVRVVGLLLLVLLLLHLLVSSSSAFIFVCSIELETRVPRGLFIHISLELECLRLESFH